MVTHESSTSDAASTSLETSRSDADLPGTSAPSELDAVFAALRHPRRRYLLSALAHRDGEQSLTRLATDILAWENDKPREDVGTDACERCRIALHHVHVPKLAELGIVDYDADDTTVRAADTDSVQAVVDGIGGELDTGQGAPFDRNGV